jgi:hypothetical protein
MPSVPQLYNDSESGFVYLHRSPASHRRDEKEPSASGYITGPSCSWGMYEGKSISKLRMDIELKHE